MQQGGDDADHPLLSQGDFTRMMLMSCFTRMMFYKDDVMFYKDDVMFYKDDVLQG